MFDKKINLKKALILFLSLVLGNVFLFCATTNVKKEKQKKTFIITTDKKTKKMSKNKLKENIGIQIRDVLNQCSNINKQVGKLQIQLAEIEQQLFDKIEKLIDNKTPFKKAGKSELTNSFNVIKSVNRELANQVQKVKDINIEVNKDYCLKRS